ncbi:MAG: M3 family metallopeptidase [Alphaproteobacteria bacterium]
MAKKKPIKTNTKNPIGADHVRWKLNDLYKNETDPRIAKEAAQAVALMADFAKNFKGKLASKLGAALTALDAIERLENRLMAYLFLRTQVEAEHEGVKKTLSRVQEQLSMASGTHMTFFRHEVAAIAAKDMAALLKTDKVVQHHASFVEDIRKNAPYMLAENVEQALAKRSPFGPSEWSDFMDEAEAVATFRLDGKDYKIEEMTKIIGFDKSKARRAKALKVFNDGLKAQRLDKYMARALNATLGAKGLEDRERGYTNPMQARNIGNRVDDATVQALHDAVEHVAAPIAQRFYKLKAKWLGLDTLAWSDRNAPIPISSTAIIGWDKGFGMVKDAFGSFSPTLRKLVEEVEDKGYIDAPVYKGKTGGAFNATFTIPEDNRTYVFLNHQGTQRCFMTLAHELGHAVHGMLGAEKQGALMWHAPMCYAETASIFAEMVTFEHLLAKCKTDKEKLALYMEKLGEFMNTVVRQISFSYLEQAMHAKRVEGKLTTEDFSAIWLDVTKRFYGKSGKTFTYDNMGNQWCYVGHFLRPFYVYAYAFGELFTQGLYAVKDQFGPKFEPMYLDLLRAGGTKDAMQLMQPFGLNPKDPQFWVRGIEVSAGKWIKEAEALSKKLNFKA